jgi:hypothetical protein
MPPVASISMWVLTTVAHAGLFHSVVLWERLTSTGVTTLQALSAWSLCPPQHCQVTQTTLNQGAGGSQAVWPFSIHICHHGREGGVIWEEEGQDCSYGFSDELKDLFRKFDL